MVSERLVAGSTVNIGRDPRFPAQTQTDEPALRESRVRSLLAVPITTADAVSGALIIGSAHADRITLSFATGEGAS